MGTHQAGSSEGVSAPPDHVRALLAQVRIELDACLERGEEFDPEPWCRQYPEAAEELEAFLAQRALEDETADPSGAVSREIQLSQIRARALDALNSGQPPDESALCELQPELAEQIHVLLGKLTQMQEALSGEENLVLGEDQVPEAGGLGPYRLLRRLELHPLGPIYLAQREGAPGGFEILVLRPFQQACVLDAVVERMQECRRLKHAGILDFLECGQAQGVRFLMWAHAEGVSLGHALEQVVLQRGALGLQDVLPPETSSQDQARTRGDDLWISENHRKTAARLVRGRAHLRRAVDVAAQVAEIVAEAHSQGFLHLGLCPRAVLQDANGSCHVRWFQTARHVGSRLREDLPLKRYLAPEVIANDHTSMGWRSDVHGVGALLYTMLRLEPPYWGVRNHAHFLELVQRAPPALLEVLPTLPRRLAGLVDDCQRRDPAQRPASCADLSATLRDILDHELRVPWYRRLLR